jgi:hypothetical protein
VSQWSGVCVWCLPLFESFTTVAGGSFVWMTLTSLVTSPACKSDICHWASAISKNDSTFWLLNLQGDQNHISGKFRFAGRGAVWSSGRAFESRSEGRQGLLAWENPFTPLSSLHPGVKPGRNLRQTDRGSRNTPSHFMSLKRRICTCTMNHYNGSVESFLSFAPFCWLVR